MKLSTLTIAALALALGAGNTWAADGEGEEPQVHRIEIQRVECEDGEDCDQVRRHVIKIDEDGMTRMLDGDHEWVGADGPMKAHRLLPGGHEGGFLGVQLTDLTSELRAHFGVPEDAGVMVSKIVEDSAAERAGVEVGDIIALVDGESVASSRALAAAIGEHAEGDSVTLELWRDGQMRQVTATLDERQGMKLMPKIHMMHGGSHEGMRHGSHDAIQKRIEIRCDDGDEDCGMHMSAMDLDIDCEAEDCEVRVLCEEDGCNCTVNGDDVDCAAIGVPHE
jgi:hypothetical protein